MKNKNIINKEIEIRVNKFLENFEDIIKEDINKEIDRCYKIFKDCGGEFENIEEEDYILNMINFKENIIANMK